MNFREISLEESKYKNTIPDFQKAFKILLVEDSAASEDLVRFACENIDKRLSVKCVKSVEAALKTLHGDQSFNLIIADNYLEGTKTGIEFWRICRQRYSTIPFMFTSNIGFNEFMDETEDDWEAPIFLQKPYNPQDLQTWIKYGLGQNALEEVKKQSSLSKELLQKLYDSILLVSLAAVIFIPTSLKTDVVPVSMLQVHKPAVIEEVRVEPAVLEQFYEMEVDVE